jgi:hypothetical protein
MMNRPPIIASWRFLHNPEVTSAPGYLDALSGTWRVLAGAHKLSTFSRLRQSLFQPGAAYHSVDLQNLPVLQAALVYLD